MVEHPPVVVAPEPQPEPTVKGALIWTLASSAIVFFLANLIAIPFIVAALLSPVGQARVPAYVVAGEHSQQEAAAVQRALERLHSHAKAACFPASKLTVTFPVSEAESAPDTLKAALRQAKVEGALTSLPVMDFDRSMAGLNASPWLLIGSSFAVQTSILLFWLSLTRSKFRPKWSLPPFHTGPVWRAVLVGACLGPVVGVAADGLDTFLRTLFHVTAPSHWMAVAQYPLWGKVGVVLVGVLGAPVFEEVFFRGILIGFFQRAGRPWMGVLVSSLLFGIAHLESVANVVAITLFGLVLGSLYVVTRSLYASILVHALNNAYSFAILLAGADSLGSLLRR